MWIAAAWSTAVILRHEMDEVFDAALQETAQRLLPLAVVDIVGREEEGVTQRLSVIREHEELFTYIVRDDAGRILLQSHAADPADFPAWDGIGFHQTATHRLFGEEALQGTIRITVAEPLDHRAAVAREIRMGLGLPLLVLIPLTLLAVTLAMRASLAPVLRFRERLAARTARDLSPVPVDDIPSELAPVTDTLNGLLGQLQAAFEAERSFAANAAHELRTPLAGAIAQVQRLRAETEDARALARAAEIEATLKRLTRFSERLMQLARAEGARLRVDTPSDIRTVVRVVVEDIARQTPLERIALDLPDQAVIADLDPDALGIVCRNLVENALRYGSDAEPVEVRLGVDGTLCVANAGPTVPAETLSRLTVRFERGGANGDGSGLGLAIVAAIAGRIGSRLVLASPRPGRADGFEASVQLPTGEFPLAHRQRHG
jgi:two-component system OmpR family sensor kinase